MSPGVVGEESGHSWLNKHGTVLTEFVNTKQHTYQANKTQCYRNNMKKNRCCDIKANEAYDRNSHNTTVIK